MLAIKAGILTASTKSALIEAEQKVVEIQEKLSEIERFEPSQFFNMTRKIYENMVNKLEDIEDVNAAREALRVLIGDVKLVPENGALTAEIENAGLAGVLQISVVAGAGFEPTTFGLWARRATKLLHPAIELCIVTCLLLFSKSFFKHALILITQL